MGISVRKDSMRGCGARKPGGLYLVSDGLTAGCGRFISPLHVCPTCSQGIKPARGWTWIRPEELLRPCETRSACGNCAMREVDGEHGLLWIGEAFYKTAHGFAIEARDLGVSRRIKAVPLGFKLGEHWVFLAHRKAITLTDASGNAQYQAGIFHAFKPTAVEYVTRGDETAEEIEALEKRGITPVKVIMDYPLAPAVMPDDEEDDA